MPPDLGCRLSTYSASAQARPGQENAFTRRHGHRLHAPPATQRDRISWATVTLRLSLPIPPTMGSSSIAHDPAPPHRPTGTHTSSRPMSGDANLQRSSDSDDHLRPEPCSPGFATPSGPIHPLRILCLRTLIPKAVNRGVWDYG